MSEILCSTGTMIGRPNGRDYRLLEGFSRQLSCDGLEFMMYDSWYEQEAALVSFLKGLDLYIPVVHCEKRIGENISKGVEWEETLDKFRSNCRIARELGASRLVMHLWDGITSDAYFENNIRAYPVLQETAAQHEVKLLVENVVCNHRSPMQRWKELAALFPGIGLIFDTKMAAFHEEMEDFYKEENRWLMANGNVQHFHVNDYAGGYKDWSNLRTLPVGKGHVDFDRFFSYIRACGYDGTFAIESTAFDAQGHVDLEMLNAQFAYIRKQMGDRTK